MTRTGAALRAALFAALGTMSFAVAQPGCGGKSVEALCQQVCDCTGCDATQRQKCEADFQTAEKLAGDKGCSDQYSTYKSCYDAQFKCVGSAVDVRACATEDEALAACTGGPTIIPGGGTNYCNEYKTKADACCQKLSYADLRNQCLSTVQKTVDAFSGNPVYCKALLDDFDCSGGTGGSGGGTGGSGGGTGGSGGGTGGSGGSISSNCYDCACGSGSPCEPICDGAGPLNFCTDGKTNGTMCSQCVQHECGETLINCN